MESDSVERWFTHVFTSGIRSASTEKTYRHFLKRFCEFAGKGPDELIADRREHLTSVDEFLRRQHEDLLKRWRNHLEEKDGLARGSVVTACNIIKSFYKANYVPIMVKSPKSWPTRIRKVPTPEELGLMITKAKHTRDKAVLICLAQSGVSLEDFLELITYEKLKDELERGIEPLHIPMERSKIKKTYDTFFGANAISFLTEYIKETAPKPKQPIFKFSPRTIQYLVQRISAKAHLKPPVTPHRLRAFFNTYMVLSFHGADTKHIPIVDYWMGHVLPYGGAYMVPPVDLPKSRATKDEERILSQRELYQTHEWAISIKHD